VAVWRGVRFHLWGGENERERTVCNENGKEWRGEMVEWEARRPEDAHFMEVEDGANSGVGIRVVCWCGENSVRELSLIHG
jgi:predicted secreted protein